MSFNGVPYMYGNHIVSCWLLSKMHTLYNWCDRWDDYFNWCSRYSCVNGSFHGYVNIHWQGPGHHKGLDKANPLLKGLPPLTLPAGKAPLPPLKAVGLGTAVPPEQEPAKKAGTVTSTKLGPGPPHSEMAPPQKSVSGPPFAKSVSGPPPAKFGSGPPPAKFGSGQPAAQSGSEHLQSRIPVSSLQTGLGGPVHKTTSDKPLVAASVCQLYCTCMCSVYCMQCVCVGGRCGCVLMYVHMTYSAYMCT